MPPVRTTPPPKPLKQRKNHKRLDNVDPKSFVNTFPRMSLNPEVHPSTSRGIQSEEDAHNNMSQQNFMGSAPGSGNLEPWASPSLSQNGGPPSDLYWPQALGLYAQPRNSRDTGMPNPYPPYSVESGNIGAGAHQSWSDNAYQPPSYPVHPNGYSTRRSSLFINPEPQAVAINRSSTRSLTPLLPNPQTHNPSTRWPFLSTHPQAGHHASNPFSASSGYPGEGAQVSYAHWSSSSSSSLETAPTFPDVDNNFRYEEFSYLSAGPTPGTQSLIRDHGHSNSLVPNVMGMGHWREPYYGPELEERDGTDAT